jgi:5-bromo-4-chloroindolyl phosphate hydrolysis protein
VIPLDDVITASTRETIRAVMTYLLERYLTVEDYLLTTGLTHQELAAIRRNLMVEQPERAPTA